MLELGPGLPIKNITNTPESIMFKSVASRSANAYQRVSLETAVNPANMEQMVPLLFDGLLLSLKMAQAAADRGDLADKGERLFQAVRILNEGLVVALDLDNGGTMAAKLKGLYDHCARRLIYAQLKDDATAVAEVVGLITPLAKAWRQATSAPAAASM